MADERESRLFPDPDQKNCRIVSHTMTPEFLIYATNVSHILVNLLVSLILINKMYAVVYLTGQFFILVYYV